MYALRLKSHDIKQHEKIQDVWETSFFDDLARFYHLHFS
jgi:hypothetical protein